MVVGDDMVTEEGKSRRVLERERRRGVGERER